MEFISHTQLQEALFAGKISCEMLVVHCLQRIETLNPTLNVFLEVYAQEARSKAEELDARIRRGDKVGRLAGMVVGIKDVLAYKDHGLQAASKILEGFISQFTATAIQRLLDEDAIIIGRQNCDEFAMGSSNENSAFGPTRNHADPTRVPGGSSGASAVAVQAGMCHASIGSDTGGSVRQPAAFCGVYGLKPTYGRISRWGLAAYASSFDCIGPITGCVDDAALLLEIMAGEDAFDSTVSKKPVEAYGDVVASTAKKRIAYLADSLTNESIDAAIRAELQATINRLTADGHVLQPIEFPLLKYLLPTYYILTTAEASSNLSRYDGVRYGHRTAAATDLESLYKKTRGEGFGPEVKRRIMLGTFVLSADYYDAYYTKAQRVRQLIKQESEQLFEQFDFLLTPTTPSPAFAIGSKTEDPIQMFLADIFTVQANVIGNPAVSFPAGQTAEGLPIGLQLMGRPFAEAELLNFTKYLVAH